MASSVNWPSWWHSGTTSTSPATSSTPHPGGGRPARGPRGHRPAPHRLNGDSAPASAGGIAEVIDPPVPKEHPTTPETRSCSRKAEHLACPTCGRFVPRARRPETSRSTRPTARASTCDGLGTRFEVDAELLVPEPRPLHRRGCRSPRGPSGRSQVLRTGCSRRSATSKASTPIHRGRTCPVEGPTRSGSSTAPSVGKVTRPLQEPLRAHPLATTPTTRASFPYLQPPAHRVRERLGSASRSRGTCGRWPCSGLRRCPAQALLALGVTDRRPHHRTTSVVDLHLARRPTVLVDHRSSTSASCMIAEQGPEGDQLPAALPARRRARLPQPAPRSAATLVRRRGAAHPPRVSQIGSGLVGVLYVLDEPSIGLHQRDNRRLIDTLDPAARPGQLGARGRARRGHDPRRPTTSSTSGRAPVSTAATSSTAGPVKGLLKLEGKSLTGPVPVRARCQHPRARPAAAPRQAIAGCAS
jgi:hypothetical protein